MALSIRVDGLDADGIGQFVDQKDTLLANAVDLHIELNAVIFADGLLIGADDDSVGPWTTTVFVGGNLARPIGLSITFSDHASYGVDAAWVNEKLLFLRVWRGRIISTELMLDVEAGKFMYAETADTLSLILPCEQKRPLGEQKFNVVRFSATRPCVEEPPRIYPPRRRRASVCLDS